MIVRKLVEADHKLVFNLGRWEPGCYKNSEAAFDVFRHIQREVPKAILLILGENSLEIPTDLAGAVLALGFPDDRDLTSLMKMVDLGISVSLWEGFNLPIAEMQWLGGTALAFNLAAHLK